MSILKLPEKGPTDWLGYFSPEAFSGDLSDTIRKANRDYLYWDRFKYIVPEGISRESAWAALKLSRTLHAKKLSFIDGETGKSFNYWLPDCVLEYLHLIDQDAGGTVISENPGIYASEKKWYLMNSIVEEAIASSQIEGAATTRQIAKEMLEVHRKPGDRSEQMIYNNYLTILRIKDLIDEPLSAGLLKELQESMTRDTLDDPAHAGRFRDTSDKPVYVMDLYGNILHAPLPPERIDESIGRLCKFAHEEQEQFMHPVVKGIILHFWLAYIHPFNDGNGRTARALFYWYMLRKGYRLFEYLSISRFILKARTQYYRSFLYSEMDEGDMTYFLVFNLRAVSAAVRELGRYMEQKKTAKQAGLIKLSAYQDLNYRQREVLQKALIEPDTVITLRGHMQTYRVVYETARTDLLGLCEAKLFVKKQRGKAFIFIPVEDLERRLLRGPEGFSPGSKA